MLDRVIRTIRRHDFFGLPDETPKFPLRFRVADRIEFEAGELHKSTVRNISMGWLRLKFFFGGWRGVMIHANAKGKITESVFIDGIYVDGEADKELAVLIDGRPIVTIADKGLAGRKMVH